MSRKSFTPAPLDRGERRALRFRDRAELAVDQELDGAPASS